MCFPLDIFFRCVSACFLVFCYVLRGFPDVYGRALAVLRLCLVFPTESMGG